MLCLNFKQSFQALPAAEMCSRSISIATSNDSTTFTATDYDKNLASDSARRASNVLVIPFSEEIL